MSHRARSRPGAALPLAFAAALAAALAGCSGVQPTSYTPIDQIPPGPGLFSGEAGEFVLYRR